MAALIPPLSDAAERTNLPLQLTTFVGRAAAIDAVKGLLLEARLVTLTGAGGIGKTRLALEVAARLLGDYEDGVWLVELAGLTGPELVPQAALSALGFMAQPGLTPTESLISVLRARDLLCVLDNCEHLIDASAQLADALLKHCPGLRILATSRDVLGVGGEVTWRVPSMPLPDMQRPQTLDELRGCETVQLLVQRAWAARPGFELNDDNAPSVVRICKRVDGIPLAIELVAARTRGMSLTAIEARMADRFNVVTGGSRVSMPRQRTLQATFDWSYDLLSQEDKRVFRRLSVFAGGFTLDAAEAVCRVGEAEATYQLSLDTLASLVDKSLVVSQLDADDAGRYRMLEPIRQYAYDRLLEAHEADAARASHARVFLDLGDEVYREMGGVGQPAWMARVINELDNFRTCLEWALSHDPPAALRLVLALERYWFHNGTAEGSAWVNRALAAATAPNELRVRGLIRACRLATYVWRFDEARRLGGEGLLLAQQLGSALYVGEALGALAYVVNQEAHDDWIAVALPLLAQAEPRLREANDPVALARHLNSHGWVLHLAGEPLRGRPKVEEALSLAREVGDKWSLPATLDSLACMDFAAGDPVAATLHWMEGIAIAGELGSRTHAADSLLGLARLALVDGQPERCVTLTGAATELLRRAGARMETGEALVASDTSDAARRLIDQEAADTAWVQGSRMSLREAVNYALGLPTLTDAVTRAVEITTGMSDRGGDAAANHLAIRPTEARHVAVETHDRNTFVREGEFWSLTFGGTVARLKDSKGLRDIARLLGTPGSEVAAVDLASGEPVDVATRVATVGELSLGVEGDVGEALDSDARAQYRARLADLEDEIAEAAANNDPERASRMREEREFLLAELGAAVGLGGRARRVLDPAERARKAVTGRIRDAISHIETAHSQLGRHLRRSVRTGSFCIYDPPEPTDWQL